MGTNLSLISSVVPCRLIASRQPISELTLWILGTTPEVERVIFFLEMDRPSLFIIIFKLFFIFSKL